jgi:hypothetical protein
MSDLTRDELRSDSHGDDIHAWFELSYANYLVLPRSLMQSMPGHWQRRMVALLNEMDEHFDESVKAPGFWVRATDTRGRFITDPAPHYNRGRTFVHGRTFVEGRKG